MAACTNCTGVPCSDGTTIGDDSSDKVAATSPFLSKSTAAQQQSFGDPQQKDFDPAAGRQLRRGKYPRELRHFFQVGSKQQQGIPIALRAGSSKTPRSRTADGASNNGGNRTTGAAIPPVLLSKSVGLQGAATNSSVHGSSGKQRLLSLQVSQGRHLLGGQQVRGTRQVRLQDSRALPTDFDHSSQFG